MSIRVDTGDMSSPVTLYFIETLNIEIVDWLDWLASELRTLIISRLLVKLLVYLVFYSGATYPDSDSYACGANTLLAEPFAQSSASIVNNYKCD